MVESVQFIPQQRVKNLMTRIVPKSLGYRESGKVEQYTKQEPAFCSCFFLWLAQGGTNTVFCTVLRRCSATPKLLRCGSMGFGALTDVHGLDMLSCDRREHLIFVVDCAMEAAHMLRFCDMAGHVLEGYCLGGRALLHPGESLL